MARKKTLDERPGRHGRAARATKDAPADYVMDWMATNCPSWTIDVLLTHPYQAIDMAMWVLKKLHRDVTDPRITEVLRLALNARKRGDLNRG